MMLRAYTFSSFASTSLRNFSLSACYCSPRLPRPPRVSNLDECSEKDLADLRIWLRSFASVTPETLPSDSYALSFTRSSGPGGQHVNRTSSKAVLRFPLTPPPSFLPLYTFPVLRRTPHYAPSTDSLILSCDSSRSQGQNSTEVVQRLIDAFVSAAGKGVPGETGADTKERVKMLERQEKGRTRREKEKRKGVKGGRREKGWD